MPDAIIPGSRTMTSAAASAFERLGGSALGRWLYARLVCWRAPYFGSIRPTVLRLEPGVAIARMDQRRAVQNHIGTVHAIAICNLVELVAGLGTDASLPASMRWLPKGMTVSYLRKATGRLTAMARIPGIRPGEAQDLVVPVDVRNESDETVVRAEVTMWVTPRPLG
jgi:acyl-coenzyme A thioesterase PaaI-like protein